MALPIEGEITVIKRQPGWPLVKPNPGALFLEGQPSKRLIEGI
jgi:hypothetical protein